MVIGHWLLVIGHWSLVIGYWSLVISHWLLVIGHWSLVVTTLNSQLKVKGMTLLIAHLGPPGTYTEQAAVFYVNWLNKSTGIEAILCP
ncbi:MAG: hypothetical protein ACYT04_78545, partial [Nostoc sp.]